MKKRFNRVLTIIMFVAWVTALEGMQPAQSNAGVFVLELAIYNRHLSLDHDDICSLALVNKNNDNILLNTAQERKPRLTKLITLDDPLLQSVFSPLTWHKYGSMCAGKKVYSYKYPNNSKAELCSFVLKDNKAIHTCSELFDYYPNDTQEYQFLNHVKIREGEIFCYAFSYYQNHLFEHTFSPKKESYRRECMVAISDSGTYSSAYFISLPFLFKALLKAPIQQKGFTYTKYDLNGAIIPDNYKEDSKGDQYSFKALPKNLQTAIIKRHQEQPKNNQIKK